MSVNELLADMAKDAVTVRREEEQLNYSMDLRNMVAAAVLESGVVADPQLANVALKALADNDRSVLTRMRMKVDKEVSNNNIAIIEGLHALKSGGALDSIDALTAGTANKEGRGALETGDEFTFTKGESVIGNDTEDAMNGNS